MPLYDESGKAIITPKTRESYQTSKPAPEQTVTEKTKYFKPVSKTTSARRRRLEGTQEFEATEGPPSAKEDLMPLTQQDIKTDITKTQVDVVRTPFVPPTEKAKAIIQLQKTKQQVSGYPKGTTFTPIATGYDVKIPETAKLDWARHYRKESQSLPPVLSEISRFGSGIVSSMLSVTKPVANILGIKQFDKMATVGFSAGLKPFDPKGTTQSFVKGTEAGKYGIHYPSTLDIAFEPFGLSPKGSSEFVLGDPFYTAGGIGGEAAQLIGFTAVFKAGGTVVKTGTKSIVKSTPKIYSKLSSEFPKVFTKRLTTTGIKITTPSKVARIGQKITGIPAIDKLGKNIYGWAAKGWKPGRKLLEQKIPKIVSKGGMEFKTTVFKPDKSVKFLNRRVWMTADDIARYNQKLVSSGKIDIMFPRADITAGVGKTTGVVDVTMWKSKGLLGRKLSRTYGSSILERQVGKKASIPFLKTYDVGKGYSGFTRKLTPFVEKVGKGDDWLKFVTGHYGLPKQSYLRPGSIISKKWHLVALGKKKLTTSFFKDIRGAASLASRPSLRQTYRASLGGLGRKASTKGVRLIAPSSSSMFSSLTASLITMGAVRGMSSYSTKNIQQRMQVPSLDTRRDIVYGHLPVSDVISHSDTIRIPIQQQIQLTGSATQYDSDFATDVITMPKLLLKTPSTSIPTYFIHTPLVVPIIPALPRLGGRGVMGWGDWGVGKKYRYREFKVASLKELLGG